MKTIGLLGGMSWESTLIYYKLLNQAVKEKLKGSHSAKIIMYSFDYAELEALLNQNAWQDIYQILLDKSQKLIDQGADLIVLCANTMHIIAKRLAAEIRVPLIQITEATAEKVVERKLKKVALIGTKYTMQSTIYQAAFEHTLVEVFIPNLETQDMIHHTIYNELIKGVFLKERRDQFIEMINQLAKQGVEGVIMGCTEIPLLIQEKDVSIPLFDTLSIHVDAIIKAAFSE